MREPEGQNMDLQVEGIQAELTRRDIGSAAPRGNRGNSDTSAAAKFFRRHADQRAN